MEQSSLTQEMISLGQDRYRKATQSAKETLTESKSSYGQKLLINAVPLVSAGIVQWVEKVQKRAGICHASLKYMELLEPDVVATIALKGVLDSISTRRKLIHTVILVSSMLEDELRFRAFKAKSPKDFSSWKQKLSKRSSERMRRTVLSIMSNRADVATEYISQPDKVKLGTVLVGIIRETTGLVEIVRVMESYSKRRLYLVATPKTMEWIESFNRHNELLRPVFLPTIEPPKDWKDGEPYGGGYDFTDKSHIPLPVVKVRNKKYLDSLKGHHMPQVTSALNAMQGTAWKINKRVYNVMNYCWENSVDVGGVAKHVDEAIPQKPIDIDTNKEARRAWRKAAAKIHDNNVKSRSKRIQLTKILYLAEKFIEEPAIYFPYQCDFRGRIYAVPYFLQPQGQDQARGLLTFSKGKPLTEPSHVEWLQVYGANLYGVDKVSFAERVKWVNDNEKKIRAVDLNPHGEKWWTEADSPWQFLAWCFEYVGYLNNPKTFVSTLPISLDASNNGLQILSLLMRDPVGGAATNCLPSEKPRDIYNDVAERTIAKLTKRASEGDATAEAWLRFGISRKTTKRPVMTMPYGVTTYSARVYVEEWFKEELAKGKESPFPKDSGTYGVTMYLTSLVWESINETVRTASTCMKWLQDIALKVYEAGSPLDWETPSGFKVHQSYKKTKVKLIYCTLQKQRVRLSVAEEQKAIDKRKQVNGVSPNFVHSLDAACLHNTVNLASKFGVNSFAMIHDSYGVLASDVDIMAAALRKSYIDVFTVNQLENFREQLMRKTGKELPPVPTFGDMDVTELKDSLYFFL